MVAVDISRWQGPIPVGVFRLWKSAGVTRVLLKLGGGDDGRYKDSQFDTNSANATAAGLIIEGYWFNGTTDPAQDAIFAHSVAPPGMRIWADVEREGSMLNWNPDQTESFLVTLAALGHRTGVYMSTSVTSAFNWSSVAAWVPLWVADYRDVAFPPVSYWSRSQIVYWQYTSGGSLPGYGGRLDLDYDYNPSTPAGPPLSVPVSFLAVQEELIMLYIRHASTGSIAVVFPWMNNGKGAYRHVSAPEWDAATAAGAKFADLSNDDWASIMVSMVPVSGVVGQ